MAKLAFFLSFSVASRKPSQKNMVLNTAESQGDGEYLLKSSKTSFVGWSKVMEEGIAL